MAATTKTMYKIPASLADNYMSMELALKNKDGIGLKPLPIRVIFFWIICIFGWFYLITKSMLSTSGIPCIVIFSIAWFALVFYLGGVDASHKMKVEYVMPFMNYISKSARNVTCRRADNAGPFYGIVGIKSIDDDGLVTHEDGTYSYWFNIVGSASILLFEADKVAILERVNTFYKKLQPDSEIAFVTVREPQDVRPQIAYLAKRHMALKPQGNPDLQALEKEQLDKLQNFVGTKFKSLHQYMIIKGDNREALSSLLAIVTAEWQNSGRMFKQSKPMYKDDVIRLLSTIYSNKDVSKLS